MTTVSSENQRLMADIGRRLDELPVVRTHRKVVVAIGLGLFFEIYEIFLSSTVSTALKTTPGNCRHAVDAGTSATPRSIATMLAIVVKSPAIASIFASKPAALQASTVLR